ncbi:hypothetical protein CDO73_00540 [Saccharibacillus sp. O23]|uniref:hypothetical protein n=1 Tax=Saccharibacillus sp. O23 TaxID=2009338 RepID=UPI000B4DFFDC|nr:hypothetical protein [Saccharibacillus sp. O23]OWR33030.1 hypothetical protein CDO73_00540 [Saccharibacillus sp. O23]
MSIYLTYGEPINGRAKIFNQYMNPFEGLEESEPNGFMIEEIPEPETRDGFSSMLMVKLPSESSEDKPELYYDYVASPETEETQLSKIQRQIDTLTAQAAALETGQEMQEDVITEIVMHVYE